ncbi:DNA polymerase III subunit beta [Thioalkalivibrio sulfidiphilus]|uniref:DNA polymerase III subunit beta n=1 Tax=Thioalkalivibrio sulfidiphilus TaxID=1033854 RepID=UPI00035C65A9|nr:DNA polymerase III subunit beta [Thioalkalivibrio sulfidiphilus]
MRFSIQREDLLKPLQQVIGAVERRQTMPILANVLIKADSGSLSVTGTDLEVELVAEASEVNATPGEATVPARKLLDICRALPDEASLDVQAEGDRVVITSGRARFTLSSLPAGDFPALDEISSSKELTLTERELRHLILRTSFAMANQDVRYYLNGLMLEVGQNVIRTVATDGHRLALCELNTTVDTASSQQVIIPRKGVQELLRLLEDSDDPVRLQIGANHIRATLPRLRFTSKLIDGRFPDYDRVIPKDGDQVMKVEREALRKALARASILSNEKYRGIRLVLGDGLLRIQAHNPEQEEAEDEIEAQYSGTAMEIGFNVTYLLDVLNTVEGDVIEATFKDANSSVLMRDPGATDALYVVMPMRL